jgi:hypothetical protein
MLKAASSTRLFYWRFKMRSAGCIFFLFCFATNAFAAENEPKMEIDNSGKGAVLCLHSLIAATVAFARICKPNGKTEIQRLENAIKRFEEFEVAHGKWAISQATAFTQDAVKEAFPTKAGKEICKSETNSNLELFENFYVGFAGSEAKKFIDNALSIPRKPVMNPCF